MTTKSLETIFSDMQQRRDNYAAARALGLFRDQKDLDVYHERVEAITEQEVKAVKRCLRTMKRGNNA